MDLQPFRKKWYRTTYNKDVAVISEILKHYQDLDENNQLKLIDEVLEEDEEQIKVKMPAWIFECEDYLKQEHGDDYMIYLILVLQEIGIVEKFDQFDPAMEEILMGGKK
jgi:hypothetical protein